MSSNPGKDLRDYHIAIDPNFKIWDERFAYTWNIHHFMPQHEIDYQSILDLYNANLSAEKAFEMFSTTDAEQATKQAGVSNEQ